jgi:hypothetical protein
MWPFTRQTKADRFANQESSLVTTWVTDLRAAFLECVRRHDAGDTAVLTVFEQSLIDRRLMTDYWASNMVMDDAVFQRAAPGGPVHTAARQNNSENATALTKLLAATKGPKDFFESIHNDDSTEMLKRVGPLVMARHTLGSAYPHFVFFEYCCWTSKSLAFQNAFRRRLQGTERDQWTATDVIEFSRWIDSKVISQLLDLKRAPGWDEIQVKSRLKT